MEKKNENNTLGKKLLYFAIGLLVFYAYYEFLPGLYSKYLKNYFVNSNIVVKNIVMIAVELVIFLFAFICYHKTIISDFKKYKKDYRKNLDIGFKFYFIGLLVMVVSNLIISRIAGGIAANEDLNRQYLKMYPIYSVIAMVFIGPMLEELIFRLGFRKSFSNWITFAIFSGLFFGGLHVYTAFQGMTLIQALHKWKNLLYIIPYGSLGFVFAKAYYDSDNIWTTITIHTLHNAFTILLIFASMR